MDEEETLWARARDGRGDAFAQLFRDHQARVYRRALALTRGVHDAEDVTAAAFFELWRKRRTVRLVNGSVLPWLLVTSVNLARNKLRGDIRHRRLISTLPRDTAPDAEAVAVDNVHLEVLGVRLTEALAALTPDDAALLTLTALDGLSVTDAAAAIGIKPGAARMRLSRVRERLRLNFADERAATNQLIIEGDRA